jgi:hypothetical protein
MGLYDPFRTDSCGFADLTSVHLERALTNFAPVEAKETVLCTITGESPRHLWALGLEYKRRASLALHAYTFDAGDQSGRDHLRAEGQRWAALAEVAQEAAWVEVRDEAGEQAWRSDSIGLREGFVLVATPPDQPSVNEMQIPVPPILQRMMQRMFEGSEPTTPPPKSKPS